MENWVDVIGYNGLYMVSDHGRFRSFYNKRADIVKQHKNRDGYLTIRLHKNKVGKTYNSHRIILESFIGKDLHKNEVNHIDENKENNRLSNLEWCNRKYNMNYGTIKKRRSFPIIQKKMDGTFIRRYESLRDTSKFGFTFSAVSLVCKKKRKAHKGYLWEYA